MTLSGEETPPQHQVFINYRGDELRKSFLGFVVKAMRDAKINVFTDEAEVKGRDLQNLFRRIEESKVAVAILSERYTESSWCLDELVKMKEQMDQDRLVVIPIFYRLDATNCKRLLGAFGDNFRNLEREYRSEPERIKKWKEALISIPQKVGLTLAGHRDESELVDSIVKEVKKILIDVSSKGRSQSTNHRTQTNTISSFEPLVAELDRLPPRLPQVFVSFCREDLGGNFARHLVWAMRESGINVLIDSYNPRRKEDERQQVYTSIEKSSIALAIFSKRYSESDQCLNELVKMKELTKEGKLVIIPVFYNVKANEVRRLGGEFGIHFGDIVKRFSMEPMKVQSWEEALNFIIKRNTGLSLERHRNEFALVAAIVKEVARLLPNSRRKRKLGIGEVFIRALTATFIFALFISPMRTPDVNFLKIGNLLVGFPFLAVVLHKILC
ncbi:unnamed protein product [Eruca vesicaria subsp. sativa]|uniref:ADP-ribosyl cyclase/cyclic ADP-ribose hydrolase n=1 Tax=Eruca vesicaria subsp. sativa TaxID=29727 RepID=A0ABC8IPR6_ERUVS|nr:unnamed protein product [Eruca vesicaria subsp. sativa]